MTKTSAAYNSSLMQNSQKYFDSKYLDLFDRVSTLLFAANKEESFLQEVLEDIGRTCEVSRVYILYRFDEYYWRNTYEWVAQGISAQIDLLQKIDMRQLEDGSLLHILKSGEPFVCDDTSLLEDCAQKEFLIKQDIISLACVPLYYDGEVIGVFGVDKCHANKNYNWSENILDTIVALGVFLNCAYGYYESHQLLLRQREQLRNLFNVMPMPIYISNMKNYSVLFCNKAISDNFDVSNLAKKTCHKIFQNLDEPCSFCSNPHLLKDGTPYIWHHHNPVLNMDFQIVDSCVTWEKNENVRFSLALDITDSLRLQREHVLEQEANIIKGHFIANMSHELRTPLNGIVGLTHLAEQANQDAVVGDFLKKIKFSSDNLLNVINKTLDLSEISDDHIKVESRVFRLSEVLNGVQAILQIAADKKKLNLELSLNKHLPDLLVGDSLRLSQIMLNLVNNAIKFTIQGQVCLTLSRCEPLQSSELNSEHDYVWVLLEVSDTGIGISPDKLHTLFTEFTQADKSITRQFGGTGLGLSIVKRFVELMGGELSVKSELGKGSIFSCKIPFIIADDATLMQEVNLEQNNKTENNFDISELNVLVVEDNDINALIAKEVLESFNCRVELAENGLEALKSLEIKIYDIVLMDIQMPILDGLEVTQRLRADSRFDKMPIVAMSAHAMNQDFEKSIAVGMQDHISKPFDPENLRRIIYHYSRKDFTYSRPSN